MYLSGVKKVIKYIGYYDSEQNLREGRIFSLAAKTKMDYICNVLNQCGYAVYYVSLCRTRKSKAFLGKTIKLDEKNALRLFMTLGRSNKLRHALDYFLCKMQLLFYLLLNVREGELILVYHSLGYGNVIKFAKKIRRFRVILEVEEVYQDAADLSIKQQGLEYRLFDDADSFIFPSVLLDKKINKNNYPRLLIHGTYSTVECSLSRFDDHFIHVVYAGTFERLKGGAIAAVEAAGLLPENYHVHILGFGSEQEVEEILSLIASVNSRSASRLTYHGMLTGLAYHELLSSCHIGISTQNPALAFNDTSFPSKIFSYMAHGLQVVSARINVVETSAVGECVEYYDINSPRAIADAIIRIDVNRNVDSRDILKKLNLSLVSEMPIFLQACC